MTPPVPTPLHIAIYPYPDTPYLNTLHIATPPVPTPLHIATSPYLTPLYRDFRVSRHPHIATSACPDTPISRHAPPLRLPSIRLERPRFVMTAACESPVRARQRFTVTYTLLNELQDFLAVRLVWTPESAGTGAIEAR